MARENLKKFRKDLGLSVAEMAGKLGVSAKGYYNIEAGTFDPSYGVMACFDHAFNGVDGLNLDVWKMFQKDDKVSKKIRVKLDPNFIHEVKVKTDWGKK